MKTVTVRVYDEELRTPYRTYSNIPVRKYSTVLSVLEYIRVHRDPNLLYRRSCYHGSCGTCGMLVNNKRVLACLTSVQENDSLYIHPLSTMECRAQLVVNPALMMNAFPENASTLRACERQTEFFPMELTSFERLEDCIECGLCESVCPVARSFIGPGPLAAYYREIINHPERKEKLLNKINTETGMWGCNRYFVCSRICPTNVNPGKKIMQLRKMLPEQEFPV